MNSSMKLANVVMLLLCSVLIAQAQNLVEAVPIVYDYELADEDGSNSVTVPITTDLIATVPPGEEESWVLLGAFRVGTHHKLDISMNGNSAHSSASVEFSARSNSAARTEFMLQVHTLSQFSYQKFFKLYAYRKEGVNNLVHVFLKYTPHAHETNFSARITSASAATIHRGFAVWGPSDVANISEMLSITPMIAGIEQHRVDRVVGSTETVPAPTAGIQFNQSTTFNQNVKLEKALILSEPQGDISMGVYGE